MKDYRTVAREGRTETVIQRSRFLAACIPVGSEAEAASRIEETRKRFWDAKHHCYAYRIGENAALTRSTDDGEPSGTAGAPILDAIASAGLTDTLCIVTRYFGGILLGTGGLVRAYGGAASSAIVAAGIVEMRVCALYHTEIGYAMWSRIEAFLRANAAIDALTYRESILIDFALPEQSAGETLRALTERTDGAFVFTKTGVCHRAMESKE